MSTQVTHLSAEQGNFEQQTEPYMKYGEGAAENVDTVMHQEHWRSFWLRQKAGQCDA